ncbi:MAG: hypothetical protein ACFB6R_02755 [Alphaproteobacteria bacterium]
MGTMPASRDQRATPPVSADDDTRQRAGLAAVAIEALCDELERASLGIEEGMIDVSAQFRGLAEQALRQAEDLQALAEGFEKGGPDAPPAQAMLLSGVNSMVESIGLVSEQSAMVCAILRDVIAHLREAQGERPEDAPDGWDALADQVDQLAHTVSQVAEVIGQGFAGIGDDLPALIENDALNADAEGLANVERLSRELPRLTMRMVTGQKALSDTLSQSAALTGLVNRSVPQVTKAIQFQDTAKQRLDNVRMALALVAKDLKSVAAGEPEAGGAPETSVMLAEVVNSITLGEMRARLAGRLLGEAPAPEAAQDDAGAIELF